MLALKKQMHLTASIPLWFPVICFIGFEGIQPECSIFTRMSLKTLQLGQMLNHLEWRDFLNSHVTEGFFFLISFLFEYFCFYFSLFFHTKQTSLPKTSVLLSSEMKNIDKLQMMKHGQILFHLLLNGSTCARGANENNLKP